MGHAQGKQEMSEHNSECRCQDFTQIDTRRCPIHGNPDSLNQEKKIMYLSEVLRRWRLMSELDLRTAGKIIGISAATLMRIEQGHDPTGETLIKILIFLFSKKGKENA